ncbi:MAG TPA: hypothetical protein VHB27_03325 [Rhodopila sp.]|uniref:hypothetical protein n=1 Tax=Rhodopila sp. TaxID=2480087 RepID=UPI002B88F6BE|nr:hypothetical protein [Rhodopila sp.]HVY14234.1 hypothetical protein [Rhodopila sp.]
MNTERETVLRMIILVVTAILATTIIVAADQANSPVSLQNPLHEGIRPLQG